MLNAMYDSLRKKEKRLLVYGMQQGGGKFCKLANFVLVLSGSDTLTVACISQRKYYLSRVQNNIHLSRFQRREPETRLGILFQATITMT